VRGKVAVRASYGRGGALQRGWNGLVGGSALLIRGANAFARGGFAGLARRKMQPDHGTACVAADQPVRRVGVLAIVLGRTRNASPGVVSLVSVREFTQAVLSAAFGRWCHRLGVAAHRAGAVSQRGAGYGRGEACHGG